MTNNEKEGAKRKVTLSKGRRREAREEKRRERGEEEEKEEMKEENSVWQGKGKEERGRGTRKNKVSS